MWSVSSVSTFQGRKSQHPFNPRSAQDAKSNTRSALDPLMTQNSTPVQHSIRSGHKIRHQFIPRSTQDAKVNTRSILDPPRTQKSTPVQSSIHPGRKSQHPFNPRSTQTQKSTPVQPSIRSGRKSQHPFNLRSAQDAKVNTRSAFDPLRTKYSAPVQPSHPPLDHLLLNILHLNHEYKD